MYGLKEGKKDKTKIIYNGIKKINHIVKEVN